MTFNPTHSFPQFFAVPDAGFRPRLARVQAFETTTSDEIVIRLIGERGECLDLAPKLGENGIIRIEGVWHSRTVLAGQLEFLFELNERAREKGAQANTIFGDVVNFMHICKLDHWIPGEYTRFEALSPTTGWSLTTARKLHVLEGEVEEATTILRDQLLKGEPLISGDDVWGRLSTVMRDGKHEQLSRDMLDPYMRWRASYGDLDDKSHMRICRTIVDDLRSMLSLSVGVV